MYKTKEHGRSKTGTLRCASIFLFAASRLRALAFLTPTRLSASALKKSRAHTERPFKTFGHFNVSTKTPRYFKHFIATPQNPAPFQHFASAIFISVVSPSFHARPSRVKPISLLPPKLKPISLISPRFTTGILRNKFDPNLFQQKVYISVSDKKEGGEGGVSEHPQTCQPRPRRRNKKLQTNVLARRSRSSLN